MVFPIAMFGEFDLFTFYVVTKDIPDNATAVGNYAKVIHYNNAGNSVNKRWLNCN